MGDSVGNGRDIALADLLDRALNKGVVLWGEAIISLAGVDLIYVGLRVLVASLETAARIRGTGMTAAASPGEEGG